MFAAFRKADKDGNGVLDFNEFKLAFSTHFAQGDGWRGEDDSERDSNAYGMDRNGHDSSALDPRSERVLPPRTTTPGHPSEEFNRAVAISRDCEREREGRGGGERGKGKERETEREREEMKKGIERERERERERREGAASSRDYFRGQSAEARHGSERCGVGIHVLHRNNRNIVQRVFPDGPSHRAGLRSGDLLDYVDGIRVSGLQGEALYDFLNGAPGSRVSLGVTRRGKEMSFLVTREHEDAASRQALTLEVKGSVRDAMSGLAALGSGSIGLELVRTDNNLVCVNDVRMGGPSYRAGLCVGDILECVDGIRVVDLESEDLQEFLFGPPGSTVSLSINREGLETIFLVTRELDQYASSLSSDGVMTQQAERRASNLDDSAHMQKRGSVPKGNSAQVPGKMNTPPNRPPPPAPPERSIRDMPAMPLTMYLALEEEAKNTLHGKQSRAPRTCGVGLQVIRRNDRIVVHRVRPDGPAHRAGVWPGDYLDYVDGSRVFNLDCKDVHDFLDGPEESTV